MTTLQITEITDGKKKSDLVPILISGIFKIVFFPFRLLFSRDTSYMDVTDAAWTEWNSVNGQPIKRKIIAETGFDNGIKFYHLQAADKHINKQLYGKIFGEFYCEKIYGLFLRQFDNPDDWPTSYLVYIDKSDFGYRRLKKSKSSWTHWTFEHTNENEFNIITEPAKTYTTRLKIKVKL